MNTTSESALNIPIVMTFSGHDPSGGAGIQADIEAIISMGCHATPIVTALTVQDTQNAKHVVGVESHLIMDQARAVLEDMPVQAFKIGLLPDVAAVEAVYRILSDYPNLPVVLDPVLRAGGGYMLADEAVVEALTTLILPLTSICTPNTFEAKILSREADCLDAYAQQILSTGCDYVLIKGADTPTKMVINTLYSTFDKPLRFEYERLPHQYHGSGCTLAAAIAGLLAQNAATSDAVIEAQEYVWLTLQSACRLGLGQHIPNRLFWINQDELVDLPQAANDEQGG